MRQNASLRFDLREEEGVTVLIVALSMAVLFGMVVLAVDLGALIVKHRGLVNANDAAALAAADSFARNEGEAAATHADRFALENLPDAEHDTDWWTVVEGLQASGCHPSTCGSVKVKYQAGQALFFAPALGLSDNVTAHGSATAIWGPAGGAQPIPIALHLDWLEGCDIPNGDRGTECAFWLDGDGGDEGGDGEWAWISLKQCPGSGCGWDTGSSGYNCPRIRSSELEAWIEGDGPEVTVNQAPAPTFVCTGGNHPASFMDKLGEQIDTFRQFPVNDADGRFAPPGQVDDKYDIVGFTALRIDQVIPGDQDGLPGGTFDCSWEDVDLEQGFPVFLSDQPCPWQDLYYPNDPDKRFPAIRKGGQRYNGETVGNCPPPEFDYCYDPGTSEISWQGPDPVEDVTIEWQYDVEPTPGECGVHELDPSAVCLVASWQGYRTGGINPGVGIDFGLRAVRLFE